MKIIKLQINQNSWAAFDGNFSKIPVGQPTSLEPRPKPLIIGPAQKCGSDELFAIFRNPLTNIKYVNTNVNGLQFGWKMIIHQKMTEKQKKILEQ